MQLREGRVRSNDLLERLAHPAMGRIITGSKQAFQEAAVPICDQQPRLTELDQAPDPTGGRNDIEAPAVIFVLLNLRSRESSPRHPIAQTAQDVPATWRNNFAVLFLLVVRKGADECGISAQHGSHAEQCVGIWFCSQSNFTSLLYS